MRRCIAIPLLNEEQILQARSVDLLNYLQTHEPYSIRKSGTDEYCLKEHDSFKMSNGKWFWHSRGFGGYSALDFLVKVRSMDFVDAVQSLTDGVFLSQDRDKPIPKAKPPPKPPKPFNLPPANKNNDRVVAYLRGRGISKEVISRCINAGILYESAKHRCVFVGKDGEVPKFACERGTADDWRKDVSGSNKRFGFVLPPQNPNATTLAVFESAVDALAHNCIHEIGQTEWDGHRLSLGGVSSLALNSFLECNPNITTIQLCLDNDKAGKEATNRIIKEILSDKRFSHMKITVAPPPVGKDYADSLKAIQQFNKEKSKSTYRPHEAIF